MRRLLFDLSNEEIDFTPYDAQSKTTEKVKRMIGDSSNQVIIYTANCVKVTGSFNLAHRDPEKNIICSANRSGIDVT